MVGWLIGWLIGWFVGCLVGWLVGWLVGTAVFSETVQRIFLIFCMKVEKWQSQFFEKNSWYGDIREKVSKLAQNQILWYFFSKTALTIFFGFWPEVSTKHDLKLVLSMTLHVMDAWNHVQSIILLPSMVGRHLCLSH